MYDTNLSGLQHKNYSDLLLCEKLCIKLATGQDKLYNKGKSWHKSTIDDKLKGGKVFLFKYRFPCKL